MLSLIHIYIKKILYKLPELINADKDEPILFVEGGKDVDNANKHGFVSTTHFLVKGEWPEEYNKYFEGRIVILLPDNDLSLIHILFYL